jgi:hypothetical protein
MNLATLEAILDALNSSEVRYLIAGGLAVNAHGYLRFTADVDLVLALDAENLSRAFEALGSLGYEPIVPVTEEQLADPERRATLIRDKHMTVLNFVSERSPAVTVDVFVDLPFDFEAAWPAALVAEVAPSIPARFVPLSVLIAMKEAAGRPRDLDDLQHLKWIREDSEEY